MAPYVLGFRKARELLFASERISVRETYMAGMVNRLVPREQFEEATMAMAKKIAKENQK